jgi:hypothetical protein
MAQRPASRAVKRARRAKKEKVSTKKKTRVAAAKPAKPRSGGKAKDPNRDSKSAKAKGAAAKPAASPPSPAAKAKIAGAKGAALGAKAVKAERAGSRPGGGAKAAPRAVERAKSPGVVKSKRKKKESAPVEAMAAKAPVSRPRGKARRAPLYLAAELGQPVDHEGEPIGAGSALVQSDAELQAYSLHLWRQMQSGGAMRGYIRAIERAGLTIDEVWTVGITDIQSTSSTPDELRRYQQKLLFRANLLEAILSETVADLQRLPGIEPTPPDKASSPD